MNELETQTESIGVIATLEQMVKVLGFHDITSFLAVSIFLLLFTAFAIACGVFLVRKRRERLEELNKIVAEVQGSSEETFADEAKPNELQESLKAHDAHVPVRSPEERIPVVKIPSIIPQQPSPKILEPKPKEEKKAKVPAPSVETVKPKPVPPPKKQPEPTKAKGTPPQSVKIPEIKLPVVQEPTVKAKQSTPKDSELKDVTVSVSVPQDDKSLILPTEPVESSMPSEVSVPSQKELGAALKSTRQGIFGKLARFFSRGSEISDEDFEEIETILFTADIGVKTAQKLLDSLRERVKREKTADLTFLRSVLKEEMQKIFESVPTKDSLADGKTSPQVLMFVGVNGAGKTTSIGKLGAQLRDQGKKVYFGAGDTFRAAATEQLAIWGQRVGAEVVSGKLDSDSAAVLFDAIEKAKTNHADYVLCDTAGRLHTKTSLMEELKKVHRVVAKAQTGAPHEVFLVIDATMGQNAITQAREFAAATPLTGVVLSKLDGTAKGGVALGIVDELKVPIRYVGIGEKATDLRPFDAKMFVDALFEEV